ncbi:MAG: zinc-binding dehydrogenase, partial [Pseudomonadota bacterium]
RALDAKIIAIDIDDAMLAFAQQIGADVTINAQQTDSVAKAIKIASNGGAHLSVDALGSAETCKNSISCLRKRGRHIQVGLMLGDDVWPPLPMHRVIAHELEIFGSHGMQAHRYPQLLSMIQAGDLRPELLIGRTISLDDARRALPEMNRFPGTGVAVIDRF